MKSLITSLFLSLLVASVHSAETAETIQWLDYKQARALQSDKPIFVFAKMRFCSACAKMESTELTDPQVIKQLNANFIPVKETINFAFSKFVFDDLTDKNGKELKFRGFPAVMIVKGDQYHLSHGYKDKAQLSVLLNRFQSTKDGA